MWAEADGCWGFAALYECAVRTAIKGKPLHGRTEVPHDGPFLRELGKPSLEDGLSHLALLAEVKPEKLERAAVRWHGRLETEATFVTLAESQLALAALASLCGGERDAVEVLCRFAAARSADGNTCCAVVPAAR